MLFTGAYANVQRQLYGLPAAPEGEIEDPLRDQNVLPMIRATLDRGIPMLGICRGFQELNVVFGGTLFPRVHEIEGRMDHRENPEDPIEVQYGPAHNVTPTQGGLLADLLGAEPFDVNSIHMQGVDRVGEGLVVEALANDGTVEALSVAEAKDLLLRYNGIRSGGPPRMNNPRSFMRHFARPPLPIKESALEQQAS